MDKKIYLIRHGQTAWSLSGQHTGLTDIPLTEEGLKSAMALQKALKGLSFAGVFSSPLQRAFVTSQQAGLMAEKDSDLLEWDYGDFEGMRTVDIQKTHPGWNLFRDGAPGGEKAVDVGARADHLLAKIHGINGSVALFSHGHFLRVFVARFLKLPPTAGALFALGTESLSILGYEHKSEDEPVVQLWNSLCHLK